MNIRNATGFILILFVCVSLSFSQNYRPFQTEIQDILVKKSRIKIGPFRLWPRFQISQMGYDGNVYGDRRENDPVRDFTATISPEFQLNALVSDWIILRITENPQYVFYVKEKRERSWNNNFSPELKMFLFHRFVITAGYEKSSRRYRSTSEFDLRANEKMTGIRGSLFYETPRMTLFGFSVSEDSIAYSDDSAIQDNSSLATSLNRKEKSALFEFYFRLFPQTDLFFNTGISEYIFERNESAWKNSKAFMLKAGLRFPLLGRIRGLISMGYKKLQPETEAKLGFSGLTGNTSLEYRTGRFIVRAGYARDIRFSFHEDNIYFKEERYDSGISLYLTRIIRLDYRLSYGQNKYPEQMLVQDLSGDFVELRRHDEYWIHSVGLVFRLAGTTGLGLTFNLWKRKSNYSLANRTRPFIGAFVTYAF